MRRVKRLLAASLLLASCASSRVDPFANSLQLVVVSTPSWNDVDGTLQRYERTSAAEEWRKAGDAIPIVVGRNGMALADAGDGGDPHRNPAAPPLKREGDGRSPAGIFPLTRAFGFDASAPDVKLPYLAITPATECVDDSASVHYNTIVDRTEAQPLDWHSSEKMRSIDQYRTGVVVDYNTPPVTGRGSCIFLHIWSGGGHGTAGCTAMAPDAMRELQRWLDPAKKPLLVQYPQRELPRL